MYMLKYKPSTKAEGVKLNHFLFGRLNKQNHVYGTYIYYQKGLLDSIKHFKGVGQVLIDLDKNEFQFILDSLKKEFPSCVFETKEISVPNKSFYTGKEYWLQHATVMGYDVKGF